MESVSQERIQDIYKHIVVLGEGSTTVTYEHWEWEEAGQLIYEEGQRIRAHLETLLGSIVRVVIENGNTATDKELHFFRERDRGNANDNNPSDTSPIQKRRRARTSAMYAAMAA